jgi:lysozyme family protein
MNFEDVIDSVLKAEGGYTDDPADNGGPTNYGITQAVARANGYDGPMKDLPVSVARQIHRNRYIIAPAFDKVSLIDVSIGFKLIDAGVNMGPGKAAMFLQRLLNVLNDQGSRYPDVFVDGRIGDVTLTALRSFLRWRGVDGTKVMLRGLNAEQASRYIEIAEGNPSQEKFVYGWLLNRVS